MLGTSDIKHYCEEIVDTFKSSYNYLSHFSEYVMYTSMIITMLSIIDYITQSLTIILKYGVNNLSFYLNFNLGIIFQFLIIGITIIAIMIYIRKSCFKELVKGSKIKEFFKFWIIGCLWLCLMIACLMFLENILVFKLNVILVLIVGITLYLISHYVSEK